MVYEVLSSALRGEPEGPGANASTTVIRNNVCLLVCWLSASISEQYNVIRLPSHSAEISCSRDLRRPAAAGAACLLQVLPAAAGAAP